MPSGSRASSSSARLVVPQREREHSAQLRHRVGPSEREQAQHDRGVAARLERLTGLLEVAPQIPEVVDLAVEDDRPVAAAGAVGHRLIAGGRQVDDRETTVPQQAADAVGVRRSSSQMPAPSGPRCASASVIRCRAARFRPLMLPRMPAIPHIWSPGEPCDIRVVRVRQRAQASQRGLIGRNIDTPPRTLWRENRSGTAIRIGI